MSKKTPPIPELVAPDDGYATRPAGLWTRHKLAIIRNYIPQLTDICTRKGRRCYFVDGLAGPGINSLVEKRRYRPDTHHGLVYGSPLLSLQAEPRFSRCLFMDYNQSAFSALKARTADDPRARVRRGDVNVNLLPEMREFLEPTWPGLVLLDPEGAEVHWATIEQIAAFRPGALHPELLVLFDADGLERMTPMWAIDVAIEERVNRFFGHDEWKQINADRQAGILDTDEARTAYVQLYAAGFKKLGYRVDPVSRDINEYGREGRLKYVLIFATDILAGRNIMRWCFERVFAPEVFKPVQPSLFGEPLPSPLPDRLEPE